MKTLLLDIGNTFVKYRIVSASAVERQGKMPTAELSGIGAELNVEGLTDVWVASVGHAQVADAIKQSFPSVKLHLAESQSAWKLVKNGYEIPEKLGVDRWLGVIEAYYHSNKMACAVFDLGTALTLDVVDALGCHCGGYILPGLSLMQDVLQLKTQQVRFDAGQVNDLAYGRNTASAVLQGTVSAVVAWINAEIIRFNRQYPNGRVYLTGGSAQAIMPYIVGEIIYDEDLILNALMRIASN